MRTIHTDKLLAVARLQHELFCLCYDFENACFTDWRESEYRAKLNCLEAAKAELRKAEIDARGYCGAYWWNIPWEQTMQALRRNLEVNVTEDKWRMQTEVSEENAGGEFMIYVRDEGHFSDFSSVTHTQYGKVSAYTEDERKEMAKNLRNRYKANEAYNMYMTSGHAVYSSKQDKVYDSAWDYYTSAEYQFTKAMEIGFIESTWTQDAVTTHTTLRSNSLHYKSTFALGAYKVDEKGALADLFIAPYKLLRATGSGADYAGQGLLNKSEKVLMAAHVAKAKNVRQIPLYELNDMLVMEVADYQSAVADSAAITCMAGKLYGAVLVSGADQIKSQEHFQQLKSLIMRLDQGAALSENELKQVLDAANRDYFKQDELYAAQLKCLVMDRLSLEVRDGCESVYYAVKGADIAEEALKHHPQSPLLARVAAHLQSLLAEYYLNDGNKEQAAVYAQQGLSSCVRLRRMNITDQVDMLEKACTKILKKATKKGLFS